MFGAILIACLVLVGAVVTTEGIAVEKASHRSTGRRAFLATTTNLVILPAVVDKSLAAVTADPPPSSLRDVDVGGGYDIFSSSPLKEKDVVYPKSMEGLWLCERVVMKVDGDAFQAETAYRCLGGNLQVGKSEKFKAKFIDSPLVESSDVVVLDRGFEIASRTGTTDVQWSVDNPNLLQYGPSKTKLSVVKRSVEIPTDRGFGFDELLRVEDQMVTRAIQVKRRYRRSFDENGNRVVEGLEITKTFRVLDGIAGTEFPTSTIKTQLRLTRPS